MASAKTFCVAPPLPVISAIWTGHRDVAAEGIPEIKRPARKRADGLKDFRCKNLIAVIEDPQNPRNVGTVIRNVNALGVEKVYVVDPRCVLPDDWDVLRDEPKLSKLSVSAVKWTFVKRFDSTEDCLTHLEKNRFISIVTSPHVKGRVNTFLHQGDFTQHAKLAVWFGNETRGISAVKRSEQCVSIPMFGMVESFNLGTSSGIVLYEVAKQRREYPMPIQIARSTRRARDSAADCEDAGGLADFARWLGVAGARIRIAEGRPDTSLGQAQVCVRLRVDCARCHPLWTTVNDQHRSRRSHHLR